MHLLRLKILLALFFFLSVTACGAKDAAVQLPTEAIKIMSAGKERAALTVELATTPKDQENGLMNRTSLPANHGMLFVFPGNGVMRFWMRNTLIPLDMIFIDQDGRITKIHEMAVPRDETYISSDFPVRAVLEVNGGTAAKHNLSVGDLVLSPTLDRIVQNVEKAE